MLATMRVRQLFDKFWRRAVAVALPPACVLCEEVLPYDEPVGMCPACYAKLPWWDKTGVLPPQLPKAVDGFAAPCLYEEPLRSAILRLKFEDGTALAAVLARLMRGHLPAGDDWLVVAVPMHRSALRARTYNQALLLAREVATARRWRLLVDGLVRVKPSDGQARRTRAQRLKLASSDFAASPQVAGRKVLLVDDIYTTGATARACALALKKIGAVRVEVVTLAFTAAG